MKMKRSKTLIAFLTFLAGMTSTTSFAYDIVVPNEDGIPIYYSWNDDKTGLAVSSGEYDFSKMESGKLVIPANVSYQGKVYPVTSIERRAYCGRSNLKSVIIPNSVTSIGNDAFCVCEDLTDVVIPNSVKSIGICAFYVCQNLTTVTMSDSVTSIGGWAFAHCSKLSSITIPESVVSIDEYAFQGDYGLTSVKIYCKDIGSWFAGLSKIEEVVIGESVKTIGKSAFYYLGIKNITIPASVTSIGESAFHNCNNLTNVSIPISVKTIGSRAFQDCINLNEVMIEGNPIIKEETFDGCNNINSIVLKSVTPPRMICSMYDDNRTCRGFFNEETYEHAVLSVPAGSYDAYATADVWSRFNHICTSPDDGYDSDFESDSIYYVLQDDGVYVAAKWEKSHDDYGDGPLTPRDPASAGHQPRTQTRSTPQTTAASALDYTSYRGNIVIPESVSVYDTVYTVTGINYLAFQGCNELESVTIPQSVKQIGYAGFAECTGLTEITIPAGVELIDQYAFAYCTSLKRVVIEGNPVIDETAFIGCRTDLEVIMAGNKDNEASDPDPLSDGAIHYGIDGRMIQPNTPGLHLIKRKDGTVVKALVR